jgi:hypothetical protein
MIFRRDKCRHVMLQPVTVAEFYEDITITLRELGVAGRINTMPNEIADAVRFEDDTTHSAYERVYANRFWRVLISAQEVLRLCVPKI